MGGGIYGQPRSSFKHTLAGGPERGASAGCRACSGSHPGCRIRRHPAARPCRQDARPYGRQGCLPLPTAHRCARQKITPKITLDAQCERARHILNEIGQKPILSELRSVKNQIPLTFGNPGIPMRYQRKIQAWALDQERARVRPRPLDGTQAEEPSQGRAHPTSLGRDILKVAALGLFVIGLARLDRSLSAGSCACSSGAVKDSSSMSEAERRTQAAEAYLVKGGIVFNEHALDPDAVSGLDNPSRSDSLVYGSGVTFRPSARPGHKISRP